MSKNPKTERQKKNEEHGLASEIEGGRRKYGCRTADTGRTKDLHEFYPITGSIYQEIGKRLELYIAADGGEVMIRNVTEDTRGYEKVIKILFVCHGNIFDYPRKVRK